MRELVIGRVAMESHGDICIFKDIEHHGIVGSMSYGESKDETMTCNYYVDDIRFYTNDLKILRDIMLCVFKKFDNTTICGNYNSGNELQLHYLGATMDRIDWIFILSKDCLVEEKEFYVYTVMMNLYIPEWNRNRDFDINIVTKGDVNPEDVLDLALLAPEFRGDFYPDTQEMRKYLSIVDLIPYKLPDKWKGEILDGTIDLYENGAGMNLGTWEDLIKYLIEGGSNWEIYPERRTLIVQDENFQELYEEFYYKDRQRGDKKC